MEVESGLEQGAGLERLRLRLETQGAVYYPAWFQSGPEGWKGCEPASLDHSLLQALEAHLQR